MDTTRNVAGRRALRGARAVLLACCTALAACGDGVTDEDMDNLHAQIASEFKRRDQTVSDYQLSKDSAYQVSGMIHVDVTTNMGVRTYYSTCLATMSPVTRRFDWHCDKVP